MNDEMKNEFGNTNSKDIWDNELLCAQFLRGYTQVPLLENVQPEDIEDVSEALRPFVGVEYEGDAVKQIHLHEADGRDVFVVGLLEHKSDVDYDVNFQLLKYMTGIWTMHRNNRNKEKEGSSRNKSFRYPLIIPVVYYEGKREWTAYMHWKDKVEFSDAFGKYVPDFTYEVVKLHSYSNEELLSREEELSLVMMLNRVQNEEDLNIAGWPEEQRAVVEKIIHKAPKDVLRIVSQMIYHFGLKMNLPDKELIQYVKNVEEREMGELWANMDKIDIQEIRRKAREETERAQEAVKQAQEKAVRAQEEADRAQEAADRAQEAVEREKEKVEQQKRRFSAELLEKDQEIAKLQAEIERLKNGSRT